MKRKMAHKSLAVVLAIIMLVGMIPMTVFAGDEPFTGITAGGNTLKAEYMGTVTYTGYSTYEDIPHYHVKVPTGTESVQVTYPSDIGLATGVDYNTGEDSVFGYFADTSTWSGAGINCGYAEDSDGNLTITVPMVSSVMDFMTYETIEVDFTAGHAYAPEDSSYVPVNFFTFEYSDDAVTPDPDPEPEPEPTSCVSVLDSAPESGTVGAGGLYEIALNTIFADSENHALTYTFKTDVENEHTKISNNKFYFNCKEEGEYDVVLTATCSDGEEASYTLPITVTKASEGLEIQYNYDETDKESVTAYVTISNDGMPVQGADGTVISNLKVTVPYFDLGLYGLEDYYRYGTENGRGPYTNKDIIQRPTGLHLYIYMLERYYMGLDEDQCGKGTSGVLEYAEDTNVLYMDGELAYKSDGKQALYTSGGATSIYMVNFWGHDENLEYFRNHAYPYISPGWGATSDYMLLSDGDAWDVGMFTDWGFNLRGYFANFDADSYAVKEGESLTVKTTGWKTVSDTVDFIDINGADGLTVCLYDEEWNVIEDLQYDAEDKNEITLKAPTKAGTYYIMAMDPNACTNKACIAPATARIVVGDVQEETVEVTGVNLNTYEKEINVGDEFTLTATAYPAEAVNKEITWKSSNENVVTVTSNGVIKGIGEGTATVTASTSNGKKAECEVTVTYYNSAPSAAANIDEEVKINTGEDFEIDIASMFTDEQNDELTYTVNIQKATSLDSGWSYVFEDVSGYDETVENGKFTFKTDDIGVYGIVVTANDGRASTSVKFIVTAVEDNAGRFTLDDAVTVDIYNVATVGYNVEFVEDVEIPYKGTQDAYVHTVILSKDTPSGTPHRKMDITYAENTYMTVYEQKTLASVKQNKMGNSFSTRADYGFFVYNNPTEDDLNKTAHYIKFVHECESHKDEDANGVCDVCKLTLIKYGDVDGDKEVKMQDISLILQNINKSVSFSASQTAAADVDGDKEVKMQDISLILQYINKGITSFPIEQ